MPKTPRCAHIQEIKEVKAPEKHACKDCEAIGGSWVHLRTCQTCGETLCCDSSPGQHMTKHFHATGHPVMASAEEGERWLWCYEHQQLGTY